MARLSIGVVIVAALARIYEATKGTIFFPIHYLLRASGWLLVRFFSLLHWLGGNKGDLK